MIIIRLTGGLGNQLFQYAFARSLSYNLGTELFLDISIFSHSKKPKHIIFGLLPFNIKGIVGYYPYVDKTSVGLSYVDDVDLTKYVEGIPFPHAIYNYNENPIDDLSDIRLPAYFQGWYQNQIDDGKNSLITENFFKRDNKLIHEDLKFTSSVSHNSQLLSEDMKKYDSVALHIRHGDYENFPKFGFCTTQYYQSAISSLVQKLDNPKFYIFTEDPDWVDENLKIDFPYKIIRFNEKNNIAGRGYAELLNLMSLCDHFILANSTFSWWAAFLSENKDKIIISPKPWFQDRSIIETDTIDNIKTINLRNDYLSLFENSDRILFELGFDNIAFKNMECVKYDNSIKLVGPVNKSKLFLKNISPKTPDSRAIIKLSFESNCFNGLRIFYKIKGQEKYSNKNSLNLFYYKNEEVNHCLILPKEALLDEIIIKPYILEKNDEDFIKINSIIIKEIIG